jgi:hypothetical protein
MARGRHHPVAGMLALAYNSVFALPHGMSVVLRRLSRRFRRNAPIQRNLHCSAMTSAACAWTAFGHDEPDGKG